METKTIEDRTFFKGINIQVTPEDWDEIYRRLDVLRNEIADQSKREGLLEGLEYAEHLFTNNEPEYVRSILQKYIKIKST